MKGFLYIREALAGRYKKHEDQKLGKKATKMEHKINRLDVKAAKMDYWATKMEYKAQRHHGRRHTKLARKAERFSEKSAKLKRTREEFTTGKDDVMQLHNHRQAPISREDEVIIRPPAYEDIQDGLPSYDDATSSKKMLYPVLM